MSQNADCGQDLLHLPLITGYVVVMQSVPFPFSGTTINNLNEKRDVILMDRPLMARTRVSVAVHGIVIAFQVSDEESPSRVDYVLMTTFLSYFTTWLLREALELYERLESNNLWRRLARFQDPPTVLGASELSTIPPREGRS